MDMSRDPKVIVWVTPQEQRELAAAFILEGQPAWDIETAVRWLRQGREYGTAFTETTWRMIRLGYAAPFLRDGQVCLRMTSQAERDARRVYLDNADRYIAIEDRGGDYVFTWTTDADGRLVPRGE